MKIGRMGVIATLLLPFALFANQSEQEKMMEEMLVKMQQQVIVMYDGMIPLMQEVRTCINGANTKTQAQSCGMTFENNFAIFLRKAGLHEFVKVDSFDEGFDFENMEWSPSEKQKILQELDQSMSKMISHRDCLQKYDSIEGFQKCQDIMN